MGRVRRRRWGLLLLGQARPQRRERAAVVQRLLYRVGTGGTQPVRIREARGDEAADERAPETAHS